MEKQNKLYITKGKGITVREWRFARDRTQGDNPNARMRLILKCHNSVPIELRFFEMPTTGSTPREVLYLRDEPLAFFFAVFETMIKEGDIIHELLNESSEVEVTVEGQGRKETTGSEVP